MDPMNPSSGEMLASFVHNNWLRRKPLPKKRNDTAMQHNETLK